MADRNGIDQKEIASVLRDVAAYVQKQNVGKTHNKLAANWLSTQKPSDTELAQFEKLLTACETGAEGGCDALQQLSAEELKLRKQYGYPNIIECIGEYSFGYFLKQGPETQQSRDLQDYWPEKLVPSLIELKGLLQFCAYREKLEGKECTAQALIDRINSFRGFSGSCHLAATTILHEQEEFISNMERHPSEKFTPPAKPAVDIMNSVNFAFCWLSNKWMPLDENAVEARLRVGGNGNDHLSKYEELARYQASIAEGLRRGKIRADVTVQLGKTYGDDAVIVKMNMDQYDRYINITRGREPIDLSPTEELRPWGEILGPQTSETYVGYEPGKRAFFGPGGVYVSAKAIKATQNVSAEDKQLVAAGNMRWLKETGYVGEESVVLSTNQEGQNYVRFVIQPVPFSRKAFVVGDKRWDSCGLHNEINRRMRQVVEALANTVENVPTRGMGRKAAHAAMDDFVRGGPTGLR